ncbi:unnamed protein product [Closterium sp. NIES-54]
MAVVTTRPCHPHPLCLCPFGLRFSYSITFRYAITFSSSPCLLTLLLCGNDSLLFLSNHFLPPDWLFYSPPSPPNPSARPCSPPPASISPSPCAMRAPFPSGYAQLFPLLSAPPAQCRFPPDARAPSACAVAPASGPSAASPAAVPHSSGHFSPRMHPARADLTLRARAVSAQA